MEKTRKDTERHIGTRKDTLSTIVTVSRRSNHDTERLKKAQKDTERHALAWQDTGVNMTQAIDNTGVAGNRVFSDKVGLPYIYLYKDIYKEDISFCKEEFYSRIMPDTRKKISELISEASPELKRNARIEYLKGSMEETVFDALCALNRFHDYLNRARTLEAILEKETYDGLVAKIIELQREIISLRKPEKPGDITDDMIRRAREYPFTELYEFKRGMALCPFHADKDPSMRLFPDNHVYCFSCAKGWDTIAFVQERDGLSFPEAVKRLQ